MNITLFDVMKYMAESKYSEEYLTNKKIQHVCSDMYDICKTSIHVLSEKEYKNLDFNVFEKYNYDKKDIFKYVNEIFRNLRTFFGFNLKLDMRILCDPVSEDELCVMVIFKNEFMDKLTMYDLHKLLNICVYCTFCARDIVFEDLNEEPILEYRKEI